MAPLAPTQTAFAVDTPFNQERLPSVSNFARNAALPVKLLVSITTELWYAPMRNAFPAVSTANARPDDPPDGSCAEMSRTHTSCPLLSYFATNMNRAPE